MDTERRLEKAFHEQTRFLGEKNDSIQRAFREQTQFLSQKNDSIQRETGELRKELATQTRWMVGLMITMIFAVVVAIFLK